METSEQKIYTRRYIFYLFTTSNTCQVLSANTLGIASTSIVAVFNSTKRSDFTQPLYYISLSYSRLLSQIFSPLSISISPYKGLYGNIRINITPALLHISCL